MNILQAIVSKAVCFFTEGRRNTVWVTAEPTIPYRSTRYEAVERPTYAHNPVYFPFGRNTSNRDFLTTILNFPVLPPGWEEYIHPDGKPYYRHRGWSVVTEVDIRDPEMLKNLECLHGVIHDRWSKKPFDKGQFKLYLDIQPRRPNLTIYSGYYYFVEHPTRHLFWVGEGIEVEPMVEGVGPEMMRYENIFLGNYYKHLEYFPCHNYVPEDAARTLKTELTFICTDHLMAAPSSSSWFPWNARDTKDLLVLLQSYEASQQAGDELEAGAVNGTHRTLFISRLLSVIYHYRAVSNYGLVNAHTDRFLGQKPTKRTVVDYLAGVVTFFSYFANLNRLKPVAIDGFTSTISWNKFVQSLLSEVSDSNVLASVLLTANVALSVLAFPLSHFAFTMSLVSIILALGSFVFGYHHTWRFRDRFEDTSRTTARYIKNIGGDIKFLSFLLSLPATFLWWSVLFFAVSILYLAHKTVATFAWSVPLGIVLGVGAVTVPFFCRMFV